MTKGRSLLAAAAAAAAIAAFATFGSTPAFAAGFHIRDHGAKALGMANAFTAVADDPSALFWNPAGMSQLDGMQGEVSVTFIQPRGVDFDPDPGQGDDAEMRNALFPVPSTFGSIQLGEYVHVGAGGFAPFGLGIEWPKDWSGRYIVTKASIETLFFNPNIAVQLPFFPELTLAAGLDVIYAKATIKRAIDLRFLGQPDGFLKLTADSETLALGFNVAFLLSLLDGDLRFGASFRSMVNEITLMGRAEFQNISPEVRDALGLPEATNARTDIDLPPSVRFGVAVDPVEDLTLSLDLEWMGWSLSTEHVDIHLRDAPDTVLEFDWRDTYSVAVGMEYRMDAFDNEDFFAFRAGGYWDQPPTRSHTLSPTLPDSDRYGPAVGLGLNFGKHVSVDMSYLLVLFRGTSKDNDIGADSPGGPNPRGNGDYDQLANLWAIDVVIRLP